LAYEPILSKAAARSAGRPGGLAEGRMPVGMPLNNRLDAAARNAELGTMDDPVDRRRTNLVARYSSIVNSPHGPVQLADGRLLYAGNAALV
jgi:hypothetical protein